MNDTTLNEADVHRMVESVANFRRTPQQPIVMPLPETVLLRAEVAELRARLEVLENELRRYRAFEGPPR